MKKLAFSVMLFILVISLIGCSSKTDKIKYLKKEGIEPYKLSQSEEHILQSFGMSQTSQIISFNAPKEAITLNVNAYRLADGKWEDIGGGAVSIGNERIPTDDLKGTFAMQLKEKYVVDFNINLSGLASYKTDEILLDKKIGASAKGFLEEFQEIEINKEIPVAIMIYDSGTSMESYTLQDYFNPSKLKGKDLVQVITLSFSDKEL